MAWNWRRTLKRAYVRVVRAPGDPADVALGMAVGVFVSLIPVAQTAIALALCGAVRRITKRKASYVAAVLGTWLTNPLTAPPLYAVSLFIGRPIARLLLQTPLLVRWNHQIILESAIAILAGAFLFGLPLAVASFEITRRAVAGYQARRMAKIRARALRSIGAEHLIK